MTIGQFRDLPEGLRFWAAPVEHFGSEPRTREHMEAVLRRDGVDLDAIRWSTHEYDDDPEFPDQGGLHVIANWNATEGC